MSETRKIPAPTDPSIDVEGFEAEPGEWPCRTYKIATRHLGEQS